MVVQIVQIVLRVNTVVLIKMVQVNVILACGQFDWLGQMELQYAATTAVAHSTRTII